MFDDLRQQAEAGDSEASPFLDDEDLLEEGEGAPRAGRSGAYFFLGMTPVQRFVLALMLFLNVCVLGIFCLLATQTIDPSRLF